MDTTIVPFLDGRGKPRQYLAIRSDITARKAAEAQLREQAALTHLGQLAAVVAHEVRNPLAGLRASLQVLDRRAADSGHARIIGVMIQRIDGLNSKVEDLLLYARPKPPRPQGIDVRALLHEVALSAQVATGHTGPPIEVNGDEATAYADPEMLRAALLNLTINACQATGDGKVDIHVAAGAGGCRIAIRDRGHGIPTDVRDRVFEPFFTTRTSGTGLGLAIVKRLLELQGGGIVLTERPGGGTVADVTIPFSFLVARDADALQLPESRHVELLWWQRKHQRRRQAQHPVGHRAHPRAQQGRPMQSHDHEACLPVAGHLRQFLRGIAIHDQRLRTKPERHGHNQLAELALGDRATVGLDPARWRRAASRLLVGSTT